MKKKIVALCLCVALAVVAIGGATLAYFTDTDNETNTFTVGNVKIQLLESQYHRVNAGRGNATGATEPLSGGYLWAANVDMQGTPGNTPNYVTSGEAWNGQYFSDAQIEADAETYKNGYFAEHSNMMPGSNVRKNPYVKNTGSNDAYIRVRVLVPVSLFDIIDGGPSYWTDSALENEVTSEAVKAYNAAGYKATNVPQVERNGIKYYQFDFTYTDPVKPDEVTFWNVWGNIAIDKDATADQLKNVKSFDVIFEADAIQSTGFADAASAFAAFDAQK